MRKTTGTIHPALARLIVEIGHTEMLVIADAGLPIPRDVERIDLAFRPGQPSFIDVLDTVRAEMVIERVTIAQETESHSPALREQLQERFPALEEVAHEELKRISARARAIVRTGEYSPFANVILHAGVAF